MKKKTGGSTARIGDKGAKVSNTNPQTKGGYATGVRKAQAGPPKTSAEAYKSGMRNSFNPNPYGAGAKKSGKK
jgi:hypothetical protein